MTESDSRAGAIVTGAGKGIGEAIAERLAAEGYGVTVVDVDADAAEETVEAIERAGGDAAAAIADVSDPDDVDGAVEATLDAFGRIDVLVNNAGIQTDEAFLDLSVEDWRRVLDVNLTGAFLCSQRVAREMVDRGEGGDIVNVTSIHDREPRTHRQNYDAAKGGLLMLTKDTALELAEHGIAVNCVAPGAIRTPMNEPLLESDDAVETMNEQIPQGRMGDPEEIADAVAYLVSDEASYVTGSRLTVDGGLSLTDTP